MAKSGKYSLKQRLNLNELYERFLALAPRQQVLAIAALVLAALLLVFLPITCASNRIGKLEQEIENHEKNIGKVMSKLEEYNQVKSKFDAIKSQIKPESQVKLRTLIENLATQIQIGDRIDSLQEKSGRKEDDEYSELKVNGRLVRVSLMQAIEFIYGIQNERNLNLKVSRLQLQPRYDNRQQFDVDFEVTTLVSKEK